MQRALKRDGQKTSHPIQVPVHNPDEVNEIFDTISYDKVIDSHSVILVLLDLVFKLLTDEKNKMCIELSICSLTSERFGNYLVYVYTLSTYFAVPP